MKHLRLIQRSLLFSLFLFLPMLSHGMDVLSILRGEHSYEQYYVINIHDSQPVSLLDWTGYEDPSYTPPEAYRRTYHFEGWIKDPSHTTCFDTRSLVLLRQALESVTLDPLNSCRISTSTWYDPYTDEYFHNASDLQIDHLVPLKNAYLAGAWSWSHEKRCNYSNFMGFDAHLIAVQKHANLSKGDRGPEAYLPINSQYQCYYISSWLRVKAVWNLKIAIPEAKAIHQFLQEHQCPAEIFYMSADEYYDTKVKSETPPDACLTLQQVESDTLAH